MSKDTTSSKISLGNVRLSFEHIWEPKAFAAGQPERYEASFIFDPSIPAHMKKLEEIKEKALEIIKVEFRGKVPKDLELCFGWGDGDPIVLEGNEYRTKPKEYDGYPGQFYISSSDSKAPPVVNRTKDPKTGEFYKVGKDDGIIYNGCRVNATITLWVMNNQYGKRINANLRGVQFLADDEHFGTPLVNADEEFDEVEVDENEDTGWDS